MMRKKFKPGSSLQLRGIQHVNEGAFVSIRSIIYADKSYLQRIEKIDWKKHPLSRNPKTQYLRWYARGHVFGSHFEGHNNFGLSPWEEYLFAYSNAASVLGRRFKNNYGHWEQLILPLHNVYRHYLELSMKFIIWNGSTLIGLKEKNLPKGEHRLDQLWSIAKKILIKIGCPNTLIRQANKSISDYLYWERSSEATRYPYSPELKKATVFFSHRYFNDIAWKIDLDTISFFELAEIMLLKHLHPSLLGKTKRQAK